MNHETFHNGKSVAEILSDSQEEIARFIATRIAMFRAESRQKAAMLHLVARIAALAAMLLATAFFLFSLAIASFIATLLSGNPFRWCVAFFAVAVVWAALGLVARRITLRALKSGELIPKQTLGVLREDGIWIHSEMRHRA